ncbi:MAG: response regulator transcription factor [Candidatus Dormibacteraeota bacterium]|nr:response regulator transcription factor [Candidatus Dormibacteraeota bacterium]
MKAVIANLLEEQSPEGRATVLIVDDHSGFRSFARRLLESGGFRVVGEAGGAVEARSAVPVLQPEVVLLDVNLPDGDGLQLAEELTDRSSAPVVVLISSHERSDFGDRLERTGARGFINKADLSPAAVADLVDP